MSRHDYDLPPDWAGMSDQEKYEWLLQERARRQALAQETPHARQAREDRRRYEQRAQARSGVVDLEDTR